MAYGEQFGQTFPKEEFEARLAKVKAGMADKGLDALLQFSPSNLFYLTGYNTAGFNNWQCLVVPMTGNPVLVLRLLERPIALATSWTGSIETYQDHEEPEAAVARTLSDLGLSNASLGAEQTSPFLTVGSYNKLNGMVGAAALGRHGNRGVGAANQVGTWSWTTSAGPPAAPRLACRPPSMPSPKARPRTTWPQHPTSAMTATGGEFFCNSPIVTAGLQVGAGAHYLPP